MLTVKKLKEELDSYPDDSFIGIRDHDNDEWEISGLASSIDVFDPDESFDPIYCKGVYVVIEKK